MNVRFNVFFVPGIFIYPNPNWLEIAPRSVERQKTRGLRESGKREKGTRMDFETSRTYKNRALPRRIH